MFELARKLHNSLVEESVVYLHWKSNHLIEKALNGHDDLDLLVREEQYEQFKKVVSALGFLEAENSNISFPGISHFYGLDSEQQKLLHLHVYTKVVTGHSWTKCHELPLDRMLLTTRTLHENSFYIASKPADYITFLIRVAIKLEYKTERFLMRNEYGAIAKEIEFLKNNLSDTSIRELIEQHCPFIEFDVLEQFSKILVNKNQSGAISASEKVRKLVSQFRSFGKTTGAWKIFTQFSYRVLNKLLLRKKKRLVKGTTIAFVGLDGTGKSTISKFAHGVFGKSLDSRLIHMGKPRTSLLTVLPNFLIRVFRLFKNQSTQKKYSNSTQSTLGAVRYLVLAWDRAAQLKRQNSYLHSGGILFCDRYPSREHFGMDSRRINSEDANVVVKFLARLERSIYESIPKPDIVVRLSVPLAIALERNANREDKDHEDFIRARYEMDSHIDFSQCRQLNIDASGTEVDTEKEVLNKLWEAILEIENNTSR